MDTPIGDVRLVHRGLRSSTYISKYGSIFRRFDDTGMWTTVIPRIDDRGKVWVLENKSISRAIAEAWLGVPVCRSCVRTSSDKDPHSLEGVSWATDNVVPIQQGKRLAPHLKKMVDYVLETRPNDIDEVAKHFGIQTNTVWTYLSKALCQTPDISIAICVLDWIHPACLEVCQEDCLKGTLTDAVAYIDRHLADDASWHDLGNERYCHARLARICKTVFDDYD